MKRNEANKNQASGKLPPSWPKAVSFSGRPTVLLPIVVLMDATIGKWLFSSLI
jgi:hypothetical protein